MSRDEDYELWLAMNEGVVSEPAVIEEVAAQEAVVPSSFEEIFQNTVDQEELEEELTAGEEESQPVEFEISPSLVREPQTNSITVVPGDPLTAGSIFTGTGEIVLTGSIEIPLQPTTGSITIVQVPDDNAADDSLSEDFTGNYVSAIAPIRASGVMNSRARESVMPIKRRRGESQTVLLGFTSVLMVTVGALVIAAYWLGVIKF
jgi:hypothetical protein